MAIWSDEFPTGAESEAKHLVADNHRLAASALRIEQLLALVALRRLAGVAGRCDRPPAHAWTGNLAYHFTAQGEEDMKPQTFLICHVVFSRFLPHPATSIRRPPGTRHLARVPRLWGCGRS